MNESVKYIIDAEDRATKKVRKVTENVKEQVETVREVGGQAKASTEIVGSLATVAGNSNLGSFAGEIAMVTERVSAFSEVAKAGGTGALAFKAGLVAAVAFISTKVGSAIGDVVFQTARWRRELERTTEAANETSARVLAAIQKSFNQEFEQTTLILDPDKQDAALDQIRSRINNEITGIKAQIEAEQKKLDSAAFEGYLWDASDEAKAAQQAVIDNAKRLLDVRRSQLETIRDENSEHRKTVEMMQKRATSKDAIKQLELELLMLRKTNEEREEAVRIQEAFKKGFGGRDTFKILDLLRERDALKEKQALEKKAAEEKKRTMDKERKDKERLAQQEKKRAEQEMKRIAGIEKGATDAIRLEAIRIAKGDEAARAASLRLQGISSETANIIAENEARLESIRAIGDKLKQSRGTQPELVGRESRLLSGRSSSPEKILEANTKRTAELAAQQKELLGDIRDDMSEVAANTRENTSLTVLGT